MKVITRCVMEWDGEKYVVTEEDSYDYEGPVALCGGGGGTNTVSQNSDPWAGQIPYLGDLFGRAQGQSYQHGNSLGKLGTPISGVDPLTGVAQNLQADRALGGSPLTDAAQQQALQTTQGGYLNANPAMDVFGRIAGMGGGLRMPGAMPAAGGARSGGGMPSGHAVTPKFQGGDARFVGEDGISRTGAEIMIGGDPRGMAQTGVGSTNPANAMFGSMFQSAGNSPVASGYQSLIGGAQNNPANQTYGQFASGQNINQGLLGQTARGDFIGANPYLKAQFKQGADSIKEQLAPVAGHMEAFGSANKELSERALTNLATNLYGGAYNTERANQLGAQNTLMGSQLQGAGGLSSNFGMGMNAQLGGLSGLSGDYRSGVNQQLGAASGFGGGFAGDRAAQLQAAGGMGSLYDAERQRQMQASGMSPGLANQDYFDIGMLGQVGQQREARGQAEIEARIRQQQMQWDPLFNMQRAITGQGGGQTSSQQPYYTNPLATGMGLGLGGLGLYNGLATAGLLGGAGYGGLAGAAGAGGLGLGEMILGGLAVPSDRRLKYGVERVGTHPLGIGVYRFKYLWSDEEYIGAMADEVEKVKPQAVTEIGGFKAVYYGMLQ